jgi:predicted phosphohydrolase
MECYTALKRFVKKSIYDEDTKVILMTHYPVLDKFSSSNHDTQSYLYYTNIQTIFHYPIFMVLCGHVHHKCEFMIRNVLCKSNPRGYQEEDTGFNPNDFIYI